MLTASGLPAPQTPSWRYKVGWLRRFNDWEFAAAGRSEDAAALKAALDRHWRGFCELQHLGALLDADRTIRAALAAHQGAPSDKIAAVLAAAQHCAWLPVVAAQVAACARMPVAPYVQDLVRPTVTAVVRALSLDAASKSDPTLAQVRPSAMLSLPCYLSMLYDSSIHFLCYCCARTAERHVFRPSLARAWCVCGVPQCGGACACRSQGCA